MHECKHIKVPPTRKVEILKICHCCYNLFMSMNQVISQAQHIHLNQLKLFCLNTIKLCHVE